MDDPNNPSIPASNSFPTPEFAVPEMPMPGPITTSTTTSTPTSTTTSTTTTTPTAPDLSPVLPAPEPEWPGSKPKSKLPQILSGIAAIILVVGVATAAYFVSNKISGRQAVAPNAPESEPLAKGKGKQEEEEVKAKWVNPKQPEKGEKVAASATCPQGCGSGEVCTANGCRKAQAAPTGYGNGYTCTSSNCPGPCFSCNASNTSCIKVKPEPGGCGGTTDNGIPTVAPTAAVATAYCSSFMKQDCAYGCTPTTDGGSCTPNPAATQELCGGDKCCECKKMLNLAACQYNGSCPTTTTTCGAGDCDTQGFSCAQDNGKCTGTKGNCTCTYSGGATNQIKPCKPRLDCQQISVSGGDWCYSGSQLGSCCPEGMVIGRVGGNPTCVSGGGTTTTTTTTKNPGGSGGEGEEEGGSSCTAQCPGSDGVLRSCTPPEADGSSYDSLCNSAGRAEVCGGNNYCCPTAGGTWTTDMTNCSTSITPTSAVGACMMIQLFMQQTDGTYQPLSDTQKNSLKVGNKIGMVITGNATNLKARFRVSIDGVVDGDWFNSQWEADKAYHYDGYEIKKAGTYIFEGQVTTEP